MIAEAIDTALALGWALLGWLALFSALGSVLLLAVVGAVTYAVRGLWQRVGRPTWDRTRRHVRRTAAVADYEEAA